MNFVSRQALGERFATEYTRYQNKDAVVICLTDEAMMVSLALAQRLFAWVLPPLTSPVFDEQKRVRALIDTSGILYHGDTSTLVSKPYDSFVATAKQKLGEALHSFDPNGRLYIVQGRDVILVADCLWDPLFVRAALQQVEPVKPRSIAVAIGNASPAVANLTRSCSEGSVVLDVFEDESKPNDRYFHVDDQLSFEEQHNIAEHIAVYWQR